jgi:Glu-tRNA(Gln) amidotransferase subunit E-like FAD-binding protein
MFGIPALAFLSSWKIWVAVIAIGALVTFSYIWVDRTLSKIHQLERSNALLEVSNKQWEAVAKEQRENAEKAARTLGELQKELLDAERAKDLTTEELEKILKETDPAKLQELVDRNGEHMRRCMEIASGSTRTEADKDNPVCP